MGLPVADVAILVVYLVGTVLFGYWFFKRSRSVEGFTAAGGGMSGLVVGLSIFGTYVSSISFLALPGAAYIGNWNPYALSLSIPLAAWIAVRYFVPYYRKAGTISAYHSLEVRFGVWARSYAVACYLLTQIARMGTVMFLLALPLHHLLGWNVVTIILVTGSLTTFYTMVGGIEGVIWTDAMQSLVLIAGAVTCTILIPLDLPEGPGQLFTIAAEHHKFSLGSFGDSLYEPTFWVVLLYGFVINLQNFGIDQSYIQRYMTASSEKEARKSVWLGALIYLPISAFFLFIGTSLFAYYTSQPGLLPEDIQQQVAAGKGDGVFPYFIVTVLPTGLKGLLVAAIFAAAMSTISSSLNCSATLTMEDLYRRFYRPKAESRELMTVLYVSTITFGLLGTGTALLMIKAKGILDAYWTLAGIFGGGMIGIFLLGILSRRVKNVAAIIGTVAGVLLICWMTLSQMEVWPKSWAGWASPFNRFLINVFSTATILIVGFAITIFVSKKNNGEPVQGSLQQDNEERL